jgi:hypothetical protein
MVTIFTKIAIIAAMAVGTTFLGDFDYASPCDKDPASAACCYHQCTHNPEGDCNRSGSCCTAQCNNV